MANEVKREPKTRMESTVRKVSATGRVMDLGLAVLFGYLAMTSASTGWKVAFGLSAAFCLFTAATAPIDKMFAMFQNKFIKGGKGK